jgi:hypothetical protein
MDGALATVRMVLSAAEGLSQAATACTQGNLIFYISPEVRAALTALATEHVPRMEALLDRDPVLSTEEASLLSRFVVGDTDISAAPSVSTLLDRARSRVEWERECAEVISVAEPLVAVCLRGLGLRRP